MTKHKTAQNEIRSPLIQERRKRAELNAKK